MMKQININRLMALLILVLGILNLLFAEKISVHGGFGWDGQMYGRWAKDFYHEVFVNGLSQYYIQRALPSAVVHYGLRAFRLPLEDQNIILGFGVLNLLLLVLAAYMWGLIADELRIGDKGKWLGFAGIFINFAVLKEAFYYPVLTDTSALALGTLLLSFFLKDTPIGVLIVSVLGAFTWPPLMYFGLVLFVFPKRSGAVAAAPVKLNVLTAGFATVAILAGIIHFHLIKNLRPGEAKALPEESLIHLSVASVVLYIFYATMTMGDYDGLYNLKRIVKSLRVKRALFAVLVFSAIQFLSASLSTGEPGPTKLFFVSTLLESITKPFIFLVAHPIYYGPILILTCFLWKPFCREVHQHGIGLTVVMLISVILSINPESRRLINMLPFFIAFTVKAIESLGWKPLSYWLVTGASLLFSKVWLRINTQPLEGHPLEFPMQRYFMNHGSWMSHQMYLVQGGFVLLTAILFYFLLLKKRRSLQEG